LKIQSENHVLIIVGPTASGKSALAMRIAIRAKGEIVSADSRQIFRHLDIGTAKPTPSEMRLVPHHMIDIKDPDASYNAGLYSIMGRNIIQDVLARGRLPIVVGGSGLYIQALTDGVFTGNFQDSSIRENLNREADEKGLEELYLRLQEADPRAASIIHANDRKRIIRALEVHVLSGKPISQMQQEETRSAGFKPVYWGLRWPRDSLYQRIEVRVDEMIHEGLVQEVEKLRGRGYGPELNSMDSVGYKEVFPYLDGLITKQEMISLIKRNTRRYAKKQITWFRKNTSIRWIDLDFSVDWEVIAGHILES
jgi:tRNA dimethylallyltransferase